MCMGKRNSSQSVGGTHGDRVCLVDLELCWFVLVGVHAGREEVEEGAQEVEVLACHIRHLEYGADPGEGGRGGARVIYIGHKQEV